MLLGWKRLSVAEKTLLCIFLVSLPFLYPHVQGDGIGYYAYARSLLIDHNLRFAGDWSGPDDLSMGLFPLRTIVNGRVAMSMATKTGHLPNHFSVGPAILWLPFLSAAHLGVLVFNRLGGHIETDGFSEPYLVAMALGTAFYSFLGLWFSFQVARRFFAERWALLATVGIWFASSLTVYMYADPSWSHGHSAFCVALFLWYWLRTRGSRTVGQWLALGLISGLMIDVYFANAMFLVVPFLESLRDYRLAWRHRRSEVGAIQLLVKSHLSAAAGAAMALLPTFVARKIVFGSFFDPGAYVRQPWHWTSPAFRGILFSHSHGLFVATPILIPAIAGLFFLWRQEREVGTCFIAAALTFYWLIACYPWWDGVLSFGNRYFVSLTPLFVVGLAATFSMFARFWDNPRAAAWRLEIALGLLIVWNLGLVFQYSTHLLPNSGEVSWGEAVFYEFRVVPMEALRSMVARVTFTPREPSLYY